MKNSLLSISSVLLAAAVAGCTHCTDIPDNCEAAMPMMACMDSAAAPVAASAPRARMAKGASRNAAFDAPEGRKMAFTANVRLTVENRREAIDAARALTTKSGGYTKRVDDASLTMAIPLAKAEAFLDDLAKLGVVTSLCTEGEDVTDQIADVAIRLGNLRKSRERLLAMLEKSPAVDELLKVERELTRVTTEIERIEAQEKALQTRVDFVTIYAAFAEAAPQQPQTKAATPVEWVNDLGSNLLSPVVHTGGAAVPPVFALQLPAGFVLDSAFTAISGDGCRLEFREMPNLATAVNWYGNDYADLAFYEPLIVKSLEARFNVPVKVEKRTIDGRDAAVFTVKPAIGRTEYIFRAAVAVKGKKVKLITASASADAWERTLPEAAWQGFLDSVKF